MNDRLNFLIRRVEAAAIRDDRAQFVEQETTWPDRKRAREELEEYVMAYVERPWKVVADDKERRYCDRETVQHVYEVLRDHGHEVTPPSYEPETLEAA